MSVDLVIFYLIFGSRGNKIYYIAENMATNIAALLAVRNNIPFET